MVRRKGIGNKEMGDGEISVVENIPFFFFATLFPPS
jgi:hypothetical protein